MSTECLWTETRSFIFKWKLYSLFIIFFYLGDIFSISSGASACRTVKGMARCWRCSGKASKCHRRKGWTPKNTDMNGLSKLLYLKLCHQLFLTFPFPSLGSSPYLLYHFLLIFLSFPPLNSPFLSLFLPFFLSCTNFSFEYVTRT